MLKWSEYLDSSDIFAAEITWTSKVNCDQCEKFWYKDSAQWPISAVETPYHTKKFGFYAATEWTFGRHSR